MSLEQAFNYRKVSNTVCTAGLLSEVQVCALGSEGYEIVINLLPNDSEYALQGEREMVERQGLMYEHIPVDFGAPHADDYRKFERTMLQLQGRKTMVHCAANYRVSAFYAIFACRNLGWSATEANAHIASVWNPTEHEPWASFITALLQPDQRNSATVQYPEGHVQVRDERASDIDAVYRVNATAFATPAEANLVNQLRTTVTRAISLVAEDQGQVVGHVLFSPVALSGHANCMLMGLAPMAVAPGKQNTGIGSELVKVGLDRCKQQGYQAVVVLGHPHYYPRFGFTPASTFGISSEYDVPDDVFMALELFPNSLSRRSGTIKYHDAFKNL